MTDGHGDDLHRYLPGQIKSNFSTNIAAPPSHTALMAYLASRPEIIGSYPEPEPLSLERRIASREGVDPQAVMVTAGATQAIYLTAQSRPAGSRSLIVVPTFSEYADACRMAGHVIAETDSLPAPDTRADTVWLCCPNNPTGQTYDLAALRSLMADGSRLTVIDAAYAAYTAEPVLTAREAASTPGCVMLRSMTKDFGVPGLRVGYAVGHPDTLAAIRRRRMPWAVGALALAAADWLLDHEADYSVDPAALRGEIARLTAMLRSAEVEVCPTDANFALCRLPRGLAAADLKEYLAACHGILIRDASNFAGLDRSYFRIAAQTPAEGDALVAAVEQWISSQP